MPNAVKQNIVEQLSSELKMSGHVLVTDYQGMTTEELNELRALLRPVGAKYKIVKNRLAKLAFQKNGFTGLENVMKGPGALAYLGSDATAIAKILYKFSGQHKNLKIKAGYLFNKVADSKELKTIAELPSREILLATLLARLNSPLQTLVGIFQTPMRSLHAALSAVAKKKEQTAA